MFLKSGSDTPTFIYWGSTRIEEVYYGPDLIWTPAGIIDYFNRADADALTDPWINETPSNTYHLGIVNQTAQVSLPEGVSATVTSRFRNSATLPDDGHLEIVPATFGAKGLVTQVFRRYTDAGTFTAGVGIDMRGSSLAIVSRISGVDTLHQCGAFGGDDVLRLTQVGDVHTMTRNGTTVGSWNDSGHTAHRGAGYQSLGLRMDAKFNAFLTTRVFSPPLRSVWAQ